MKLAYDCIPCLIKQTINTLERLEIQPAEADKIIARILDEISQLSFELPPPLFGRLIYRTMAHMTETADPFDEIKHRSNRKALSVYDRLRSLVDDSSEPLFTALAISMAGNIIDFGVPRQGDDIDIIGLVDNILHQIIEIDLRPLIVKLAQSAENILFIGDNAGEIVFDKVLIEQLPEGRVTYAVRGSAVLNDATYQDAVEVELDELVPVITTGSDVPGCYLPECSADFRRHFQGADLIIAKGQGNLETLWGVEAPIFFLFMVKCAPVARMINASLYSGAIASSYFK